MTRLEIESLAGGGRGVARAEGRTWFVAGALPGELVDAEVERERAGIVEARTVAVVRPSPWRNPGPCPVAAACGGCDLDHVSREAAPDALRAVVLGALRHAPRELSGAVAAAGVVVSPWHYRLRATLHWDPETGTLGFFGPSSHEVVDITPCHVVSPLLLEARPRLAAALAAARLPAGELSWLEDLGASRAVAGWTGWGRPPHPEIAALTGFHPLDRGGRPRPGGWGDTSISIRIPVAPPGPRIPGVAPRLTDLAPGVPAGSSERGSRREGAGNTDLAPGVPAGSSPSGRAPVARDGARGSGIGTAAEVELVVPVGAFFQGNRFLVPRLFERVAQLVRSAGLPRVVDLYGGVGFLASAARHAGAADVTVVEASGVAASAARANLPGARVLPSSAEGYVRRPRSGSGTLAILAPPRRGLSPEVRDGVLAWRPEAIVLLACDPASFGRDAGALLAAGWALESVELWDLFAGSHHVETLASFRRQGA